MRSLPVSATKTAPFGVDGNAARPEERAAPLALVLAVLGEHLHALVPRVGDEDVAVRTDGDAARLLELPRQLAARAPRAARSSGPCGTPACGCCRSRRRRCRRRRRPRHRAAGAACPGATCAARPASCSAPPPEQLGNVFDGRHRHGAGEAPVDGEDGDARVLVDRRQQIGPLLEALPGCRRRRCGARARRRRPARRGSAAGCRRRSALSLLV